MVTAPSGQAVLAVEFVILGLAACLVVTRLHLRLHIQRQPRLLASDHLLILSWVAGCVTAAFDVVFYTQGVLQPDINYTLANWEPPSEDALEFVLKMLWASVIPFFTALVLCKASLLAIYLQLFPVHMTLHRIALWAAICYCAVAFFVSLSVHLFICLPINRNWNIADPASLCPGAAAATVFHVAWSLHIFGSIILFLLPFTLIYKLQLSLKMRISVYAVLLLGLVDIAFSIIRFLTVQLGTANDFTSLTIVSLWSTLDVGVAIIVSCLPSLRPYLRKDTNSSSAGYDLNSRSRSAAHTSSAHRPKDHHGFEELDNDLAVFISTASGNDHSSNGGSGSSTDNKIDPTVGAIAPAGSLIDPKAVVVVTQFSIEDSWDQDRKSINRSDDELVHSSAP